VLFSTVCLELGLDLVGGFWWYICARICTGFQCRSYWTTANGQTVCMTLVMSIASARWRPAANAPSSDNCLSINRTISAGATRAMYATTTVARTFHLEMTLAEEPKRPAKTAISTHHLRHCLLAEFSCKTSGDIEIQRRAVFVQFIFVARRTLSACPSKK